MRRLSFENDLRGKGVAVIMSREHLGDISVLVSISEGGRDREMGERIGKEVEKKSFSVGEKEESI